MAIQAHSSGGRLAHSLRATKSASCANQAPKQYSYYTIHARCFGNLQSNLAVLSVYFRLLHVVDIITQTVFCLRENYFSVHSVDT